jgi:hypothetical protein
MHEAAVPGIRIEMEIALVGAFHLTVDDSA